MYPGTTIDASVDGDLHHWIASQHPGMAIDAFRVGDRCIRGWRSIHHCKALDGDRCIPGWRSMHPGMVIAESRDGDQCIQGRRSMHPWMAIVHHWKASQHPWMAIDASRDGDHVSRDGYHCIPEWRSINLAMASVCTVKVTGSPRGGRGQTICSSPFFSHRKYASDIKLSQHKAGRVETCRLIIITVAHTVAVVRWLNRFQQTIRQISPVRRLPATRFYCWETPHRKL